MTFIRLAMIVMLGLLTACQRGDGPVFAPGVAGPARGDQMVVGARLMDAGEYELALKAFTRAAAQQGLNSRTLTAIGSANLGLGRLGQAERLLRRAVKEDEDNAAAWNNLGVVLMEKGAYPEAAQVFRRAFALSSGASETVRDNLAKALAKRDAPSYDEPNNSGAQLVRRGAGDVLLVTGI